MRAVFPTPTRFHDVYNKAQIRFISLSLRFNFSLCDLRFLICCEHVFEHSMTNNFK
jgi:hypothetical protein